MAQRYFEVTLKRSPAGRPDAQRRTLRGLGLTRPGETVYLKDQPAVRGMLYKVVHMVDVVPKEGTPPPSSRARAQRSQG